MRVEPVAEEIEQIMTHSPIQLGGAKRAFKETELGLLPDDWIVSSITESCDKPEYGYTASAEQEPVGPRFLRITDIQEQGVDWDSVPYCRYDEATKKKHRLQPGDLLFARIGATTGKSFLVRRCPDAVYASYLIRVRAKTVDPAFLYYFCNSEMYWRQINASKGDKLKGGVSGSVLAQVRHCLPPLLEQRAIAAVLSKIQAAVEVQDKIVATLKELKAATMAKLFREGLRGEPLKQTEVGEIPGSWGVVQVGDYCERPRYGYTESACSNPIGPKFLRITDITEYGVDWDSVPYCLCPQTTLDEFRLEPGDLVFARIGATTGKSYLITDCPESVFASYLIRLRTKPSLDPIYLSCFFESEAYWRQVRANKGNNLKGGMSAAILASLLFPLPPQDEQQEIAVTLKTIERRIALVVKQRDALKFLFSSMLHLLMTGQVRVTDLMRSDGDLLSNRSKEVLTQ